MASTKTLSGKNAPTKKKLDVFNFFYSFAAVIILIGVIAKLLEWEVQDFFMTLGLSTEAVVFAVTAIKFVEVKQNKSAASVEEEEEDEEEEEEPQTLKRSSTQLPISENKLKENKVGSKLLEVKSELPIPQLEASSIIAPETSSSSIHKLHPSTAENIIEDKVQVPVSNNAMNSHTLWQLEQLNIVKIAPEIYFQPLWIQLSDKQYVVLANLFARLFGKKLPSYDSLPFLSQSPISLPISKFEELKLENSINELTQIEVSVLGVSAMIAGFYEFFDQFIIAEEASVITIRNKTVNETQAYCFKDEAVQSHLLQYHTPQIVMSPQVEELEPLVSLKGKKLWNYMINAWDKKDAGFASSLIEALRNKGDEYLLSILKLNGAIQYNVETNQGYDAIYNLTKAALCVEQKQGLYFYFNHNITFILKDATEFNLTDVVDHISGKIYYGEKSEYKVSLIDIFPQQMLDYVGYVKSLIDKMVEDGIANQAAIYPLFNLKDYNDNTAIYKKMEDYLQANNLEATGAQMAFQLLYKQYK